MLDIENASIVDGYINGDGRLILIRHDGGEVDAGSALPSIPDASDILKGAVELATTAETITGTDSSRAVTPAGLSSVVTPLNSRISALEAGGGSYLQATPLTNNQWYRIASFSTSAGVSSPKASAEFVITTDGTGQNGFLRLRASVAFNDFWATLSLEEYSAQGSRQFNKARIVALNGTNNGHALEIYHTTSPVNARYKVTVKHDDWLMPSGFPQTRWGNLGFTSVSSTPTAPATVLIQRGIGFTGIFATPTFLNSWVNYDSVHESAGFTMRAGSIVELKGVIKDGLINVFTGFCMNLPEGYRPALRSVFGVGANGDIGRIDVFPDGNVLVHNGSTTQMSLHGISFLATQ